MEEKPVQKTNRMAFASLLLGLLCMATSMWFADTLFGWLDESVVSYLYMFQSPVFGLLAVVLGVLSLDWPGGNKVLGIGGILLGIPSLLLALLILVFGTAGLH